MDPFRSEQSERRRAAHARGPVLPPLPVGLAAGERRGLRSRLRERPLGQSQGPTGRPPPLHRRECGDSGRRAAQPPRARRCRAAPRQRRGHAAGRRLHGLRVLARRAAPRARYGCRPPRVRSEAEARRSVSPLPLLCLRQSARVVPLGLVGERPGAEVSFPVSHFCSATP
jgi:hypothetical protein